MSDYSNKIVRGGGSWRKFEMASLESPFLSGKKDKGDFVSLQTGEEEVTDFISFQESGGHLKKLKEAKDILEEAQKKATLLEKEGYEKGFAQGEKDGLAAGEKKALKVVKNIENLLTELGHLKKRLIKAYEKEILEIIFAIAKKIIHFHIRTDEKTVKETLLKAVHLAAEKSRMVFRVNPKDLDYMEKLRPEFQAKFKELKSISVTSDPSISKGGCFLETPYGDVDARIETQLEKIHQCLEEVFTKQEDDPP